MSTRILDTDKVLALLRSYRPGLAVEKAGGGKLAYRFLCPFHSDTNPSFVFTPSNGSGFCHACKTKVFLPALVMRLENTNDKEAERIVDGCKRFVKQEVKSKKTRIDISEAQITAWQEKLPTESKLLVMMQKWGWTTDVIARFKLGCADGRLTIPMYENEDLVGLKYYAPGAKMKYQNVEGSASGCWPLENLIEDAVYLVEGEKDCLTMISAGFNAVTFTTGAAGVPKDYIRYFAGKTVYIIYDIDEMGRNGAVNAAAILSCATKSIYIVELPLDGIPKGDVTDAYLRDKEGFVEFINYLVENTSLYQAQSVVNRVHVPPEVHKTYLEEIVDKGLFYRRVSMKVRVVGRSYHETVIVPKNVELTCNKDYKEHLCQQCKAHYEPVGLFLHVRPEYPELMSMVGNNTKVQRTAIQSMTDVIEGCTKFKIKQVDHQALYRVTLIPAIEADKKNHNYQMVEGWVLDVASKDNVDYDVEGVVLANPDTQHLELICYKMKEDVESIDSFELTDQLIKDLEVFQVCNPQPSTVLNVN